LRRGREGNGGMKNSLCNNSEGKKKKKGGGNRNLDRDTIIKSQLSASTQTRSPKEKAKWALFLQRRKSRNSSSCQRNLSFPSSRGGG